MLLLVDIGNTSITIGFHDGSSVKKILRLKTINDGRSLEEYSYILKGFILRHKIRKPEGSVISSVVPQITPALVKVVKKDFGLTPLIVSSKIKTGLKFMINNIEGLGADRIANAVAAHRLYKGPLLVIDFGTATTFSYVSLKGQFRGGAIMPGIRLSADALAANTARLPGVNLRKPERALGRDTIENILSGIIFGHAGAVEKLIDKIKSETSEDFEVIATGGHADLMAPHIKVDHINPLLTLEGLRFIYELNSV